MSGWAWEHVPRAWRSPATRESRGAADLPHGQPGPREVFGDPPPAPLNAEGKWVMAGVLSSSLFANLPLPILLGKVFIFFKKSFQRGFVVIHETKIPIVGCITGPSPPRPPPPLLLHSFSPSPALSAPLWSPPLLL